MEMSAKAERALVGALLSKPKKAAPILIDRMQPERIGDEMVRRIYTLAIKMFCDQGHVDETPLMYAFTQEYEGSQDADTVNAIKYLFNSFKGEFSSIDALPGYIKMVNDTYKASVLTEICSRFVYGQTYRTDNIDEKIAEVAGEISDLLVNSRRTGLVSIEEFNVQQYTRLFDKESLKGNVRTGFQRIDHYTRGFRKKQLIILAARPKLGKSALALNWSIVFAQQNKRVALFSMEMSKEELYERYMSNVAHVNLGVIQDREFGDAIPGKLATAAGEIGKLPLWICDEGSQTVEQIRMECKIKQIEVVIIDYLQLIRVSGRSSSRYDEVSQITRSLKQMAMELDIPVIVLSQLNRKNDEGEEPFLINLRDSGSIEQDANMVLMLWNAGIKPISTEKYIACKVAANRSGKCGEVVLRFEGGVMSFEETDLKVVRDSKKKKALPWQKGSDDFVEVEDQQVF